MYRGECFFNWLLSQDYQQETNRFKNSKGEQWNKPVEKTSQVNRELLVVLETLLGYVEQNERIQISQQVLPIHSN